MTILKKSHQTEIDMPSAIGQYNKCMGGIDKMDMLIALHPCRFKVRRWPMKIFFHLLDLTLCNAWLLYQLEFNRTHPGEKHLDLYHFKRSVSEVWIKQNTSKEYHILRYGSGRVAEAVPRVLRFDGEDHFPHSFSGYNDRHRCALCKHLTNMFCMKYEGFLCCSGKRNCYTPFHTELKGQLVCTPAYLLLPDNETESDSDSDPQNTQSVPSNPDSDLE